MYTLSLDADFVFPQQTNMFLPSTPEEIQQAIDKLAPARARVDKYISYGNSVGQSIRNRSDRIPQLTRGMPKPRLRKRDIKQWIERDESGAAIGFGMEMDPEAGPTGEHSRQLDKLEEERWRLKHLSSKLNAAVNELRTLQDNREEAVRLYARLGEAKRSGWKDRMSVIRDCEEQLREHEQSMVANQGPLEQAIQKIKDIRTEVNEDERWTQRVGGY